MISHISIMGFKEQISFFLMLNVNLSKQYQHSATQLSIRQSQTSTTNKELSNKHWTLKQYHKILIKTHAFESNIHNNYKFSANMIQASSSTYNNSGTTFQIFLFNKSTIVYLMSYDIVSSSHKLVAY